MFDIAPLVRDAMSTHADFQQIGKRMLLAWRQGIGGLYDRRVYSLPVSRLSTAFDAISDPAPVKPEQSGRWSLRLAATAQVVRIGREAPVGPFGQEAGPRRKKGW